MHREEEPTLREWYEQLKARVGLADATAFDKASFKWPEKSPYSFVPAGAPRPWGWLLLWLALITYWVGVQIINAYIRNVLSRYPEYLSEIDWELLAMMNELAFWVGVSWIIMTATMFFYMTLNTWGRFDTQFEPCIVWTLEGKPLVVVLRLEDWEELWPLPKEHELMKFLERIEEEEMVKYVGTKDRQERGDGKEEEINTTDGKSASEE